MVNSLLTTTRIFNMASGASYRRSDEATCLGTKAEVNTQWGCPVPEVRRGAGRGGLKFINRFRNY